eukprot:TRINITY_DN558_c0_g1_i1.p1 TRINITY_DN558_c0_g1~~TRINITY_DN558_c0_g1_i1.p1  ORF type:complete len:169 (-),score=41.74 TRINITY_DN558_c0_g1_i1:99-605(-)
MPSAVPLLPFLRAFVAKTGYKVCKQDERSVVMLFSSQDGDMKSKYYLVLKGRDKEADISVSCVWSTNVPPEFRVKVAEYCTRANYGLSYGVFKIDKNDGEVIFECTADIENCSKEAPTNIPTIIDFYVSIVTSTWQKYRAGLTQVADGRISPAEAIRNAESSRGSDSD